MQAGQLEPRRKSQSQQLKQHAHRGSGRDHDDKWQGNNESFYAAAVSPESVKHLKRHRERIEKDVAALDSRLAAGSSRGEHKLMERETEGAITELEDRMAEVLQMHSQQLRERAVQPNRGEECKYEDMCRKCRLGFRRVQHTTRLKLYQEG